MKNIFKKISASLLIFSIFTLSGVAYASVQIGGSGNNNKGYAEMMVTGGGTQVINGTNQWHAYVGASVDEISDDITFHTGAIVDLTGATFASADGGASTQITGVTHGLSIDDIIVLNGVSTAGYNSVAQVSAVGGSNDFTIDIAFIDDPATEGFFQHPDHFEIGENSAGTYVVNITNSGTVSTTAATLTYAIYDGKALKHKIPRRYPNTTDIGATALTSLVTVSAGDEIWFGILNATNANDIDIDELSFIIFRQ